MLEAQVGYGTSYSYEPFCRAGDVVYVAGQIPKTGPDTVLQPGLCGDELDLEAARESAALAARQAIYWIETAMTEGEALDRVLRLSVFVAVADGFAAMSDVADAASEVFIAHFGARGRHPRSVLGVRTLPRNAPVLIEVTARLAPRTE
jgi:enamine deaminase RidA (YjgF/YER057c/UK114 family)